MVQSPVQLPVSGSQSRARGRRVESMVAEQGRPRDPMPPQLKTPYHENSSIVAGVDGVVEPLDLVRFRSRWPPRPGLPPPAGAKRPRRRKRTVALPLLTGTRPPARAQRPPTPAGAKRPALARSFRIAHPTRIDRCRTGIARTKAPLRFYTKVVAGIVVVFFFIIFARTGAWRFVAVRAVSARVTIDDERVQAHISFGATGRNLI